MAGKTNKTKSRKLAKVEKDALAEQARKAFANAITTGIAAFVASLTRQANTIALEKGRENETKQNTEKQRQQQTPEQQHRNDGETN